MTLTDKMNCPVHRIAHRYDDLARQWLDTEDDAVHEELGAIVLNVTEVDPQSADGALFQVMCARSELDAAVNDGDAPHIKRASLLRVAMLLDRALPVLHEMVPGWENARQFVLPAGDDYLEDFGAVVMRDAAE